MAVLGEIRWMPPVGRTNGRRWGDPMAAVIGGVISQPAAPASLGGDMRLSNLRSCGAAVPAKPECWPVLAPSRPAARAGSVGAWINRRRSYSRTETAGSLSGLQFFAGPQNPSVSGRSLFKAGGRTIMAQGLS